MKQEVFDIVLLIALPASGKSEVRHYMSSVPADRLRKEFHIGENLQLDDFPYVFMMRRIDEELEKLGEKRPFYPTDYSPFFDGRDWGTLVHLLNEDYRDMRSHRVIKTDSAAELLFDRLDTAGLQAGIEPRLALLKPETRKKLAAALEPEARKMLEEKQAAYPDTMEGKTLIIECARGGQQGAAMPLEGTAGYQYTLPLFSPEILSRAAILYIWVTPEESRRKNADRADPNDPGSNLHHSTPMEVMLYDYGCDDMEYLTGVSGKKNTVKVESCGKEWFIPTGILDNRQDKTSFLRDDPSAWKQADLDVFAGTLKTVTDGMYEAYKER